MLGAASAAFAGPAEQAAAEPAEAGAPAEVGAEVGAEAGAGVEVGASVEAEASASAPAQPPPPPVSVSKIRRDMESGMATLGDLASEAKRDSDLVRAACVLDKQERAQGVMELATGEMLVIQDSGASAEARSFATEKLAAASGRLDALVEQARECLGEKPSESSDETTNEVREEPTIPIADPTVGGGPGGSQPPRMPPPIDDGMPPSVGSPSL